MIEGRPDWCVLDKEWGVPLPIFINRKKKRAIKRSKNYRWIASIYEKQGSDCGSRMMQNFLGDDYDAKDCEKLKDIVEVWFDSGSTHSFVLEKRFKMACRHVLRDLISIEIGFIPHY